MTINEKLSKYLNERKESVIDEKVEKLSYSASMYIQKEDDKFILYVKTGGPEFYKEFDDKKSALKEFNNNITKISKGYEKI